MTDARCFGILFDHNFTGVNTTRDDFPGGKNECRYRYVVVGKCKSDLLSSHLKLHMRCAARKRRFYQRRIMDSNSTIYLITVNIKRMYADVCRDY